MTPGVIPMIAPDGTTGDIPSNRQQDALNAGFKLAVVMTSPDGRMGYVPRERAADAMKAGFKVGQPTTSAEQSGPPAAYGFTPGNLVKNVGRGLSELGQGVVQGLDDVGGAILPQRLGGDPITQTKLVEHIVQPMQAEAAKARELQAQGQPYVGHAMASGIPLIGPYAANLGDQAATGDIGGMVARGGTQIAAPLAVAKAAPLIGKLKESLAPSKLFAGKQAVVYPEAANLPPEAVKAAEGIFQASAPTGLNRNFRANLYAATPDLAETRTHCFNDLNEAKCATSLHLARTKRVKASVAAAKRLGDVTDRCSKQVARAVGSQHNAYRPIGECFGPCHAIQGKLKLEMLNARLEVGTHCREIAVQRLMEE
jgi:hypothetical protein